MMAVWRLATIVLLGLSAGCASTTAGAKKPAAAATPQATRAERAASIGKSFEQQRAQAEFREAVTAYEQGDLVHSREVLSRLLERNAEHREARLLLGDVLLSVNEPAAAQQQCETVLQKNSSDPQAHYVLALALDAQARPADALEHYVQAAQLDPSNDVFRVSYETARKTAGGDASPAPASSAGKTPPGVLPTDMVTASDQSPALLPRPTTPLQKVRQEAASKAPQPLRFDVPLTDEHEHAAEVRAALAQAQKAVADGAPEQALAALRQAIQYNPRDPHIPIALAVNLLRAEQTDLAVRLLREAATRHTDCAAVQRTLGMALYRQGDYRASQVALRQALSLDKSSALSYFLMGCTLARLGQSEAAAAHFRQAQLMDSRYAATP